MKFWSRHEQLNMDWNLNFYIYMMITLCLRHHNNNKTHAAKALGIGLKSLRAHLKAAEIALSEIKMDDYDYNELPEAVLNQFLDEVDADEKPLAQICTEMGIPLLRGIFIYKAFFVDKFRRSKAN